MNLNSIIDVQITRETKTPTQQGFGTLLLIGDADNFGGARVRTYKSIEEVAVDFLTSDWEYQAAQAAFGQEVAPEQIKIGTVLTADAGNYVTALNAIQAVDDDFYGIAIKTEADAAIGSFAAAVEAKFKLFFGLTRDAAVPANTGGNVAADLFTAAYDRSALFYSGAAASMFLQAAIAGGQLPKVPGGITYKFKRANGVTADNLTATQITNIENNKCNHYGTIAGINLLQQGVVSSGEFIDVIIGADYITARMQETIYQALVNADKIPYTNQGISVIENLMRQVLNDAVNKGILASFTITVPDVSDISNLDKGNRFLPDMEFTGVLAGAVHKVQIRGRLVL